MGLPKSLIHIPSSKHTHQIKWIEHRNDEVSLVLVAWALDLRDSIFSEIYLIVSRQEAHRMVEVHQEGVDDHKCCFEDAEEPLVLNYGRYGTWIEIAAEVETGD